MHEREKTLPLTWNSNCTGSPESAIASRSYSTLETNISVHVPRHGPICFPVVRKNWQPTSAASMLSEYTRSRANVSRQHLTQAVKMLYIYMKSHYECVHHCDKREPDLTRAPNAMSASPASSEHQYQLREKKKGGDYD